jgi:hypothetical protein
MPDFIVEGETEVEIRGFGCKDFIFCETCQEFVDFFQYQYDLQSAGHKECKWRYVTSEELRELAAECEDEYIPFCQKCDSIVDYEYYKNLPCGCCGESILNPIWRNSLGEER